MVPVYSGLYAGMIYLVLGPMALLVLKLLSDSRFFRKGINVKYGGNFALRVLPEKQDLGKGTYADVLFIPPHLDLDSTYCDRVNKALYEEAMSTGRFKLSGTVHKMLETNRMICLRDITKRSLSAIRPSYIVVVGQRQKLECLTMLGRPSKYNSSVLLAISLRGLDIAEFDPIGMVIK